MVYRFGVANHLVDENLATLLRVPQPVRSERMLPFTIAEVDRVAEECGRWGPLVCSWLTPAPGLGRRSQSSGDMSI
jgi:hypothetical protein